ncbi:hypothetical protein COCON_G00146430 [Conger conger]|uniref:Uncharacterized protein n=1 Tax=Conger conger TaxID=82655 RepID=A0A9Q1DCN5_CONCO|nr:hypothetical protein COCON_G00146430 [Conger conger]
MPYCSGRGCRSRRASDPHGEQENEAGGVGGMNHGWKRHGAFSQREGKSALAASLAAPPLRGQKCPTLAHLSDASHAGSERISLRARPGQAYGQAAVITAEYNNRDNGNPRTPVKGHVTTLSLYLCTSSRSYMAGGISRAGPVPAFLRTPAMIQPHLDLKSYLQFPMETAPPPSIGLFHNFSAISTACHRPLCYVCQIPSRYPCSSADPRSVHLTTTRLAVPLRASGTPPWHLFASVLDFCP